MISPCCCDEGGARQQQLCLDGGLFNFRISKEKMRPRPLVATKSVKAKLCTSLSLCVDLVSLPRAIERETEREQFVRPLLRSLPHGPIASVMSDARRKEIEAMRQRWLEQKRMDDLKQQVIQETRALSSASAHALTVASSSSASGPTRTTQQHQQQDSRPVVSSANPMVDLDIPTEQVISSLADRLTEKLRTQLRSEIAMEIEKERYEKQRIDARMERDLASEIESHSCPICFELMAPPVHSPMLLFPCGHSFCAACMKSNAKHVREQKCPFCRAKVQSMALNISLQNLIETFVSKRTALLREKQQQPHSDPLSSAGLAASAADRAESPQEDGAADISDGVRPKSRTELLRAADQSEERRYLQEYRTFAVRCEVLRNEFEENRQEVETCSKQKSVSEQLLAQLGKEATDMEDQIARLTQAVALTKQQIDVQETKKMDASRRFEAAGKRLRVLESTYLSVRAQKDKAKLILRNMESAFVSELSEDSE